MNNVLLSIIIPLYNSQAFLSDTLNNILSSSDDLLKRIEIILIDDGSTDGTKNLCLKYTHDFECVKYHYKENGGIASARNYGIKKASGQYLFFHDHDDLFEINNLDKIISILDLNDSDLLFFNSYIVENGNKKVFAHVNECLAACCDTTCLETDILKIQFHLKPRKNIANRVGNIWSTVLKKKFIIDKGIRFKIHVDFDDDFNFIAETISNNAKIRLSTLFIYRWNFSKKSMSHHYLFSGDYPKKVLDYKFYLTTILDKTLFSNQEKELACNNVIWDKIEEFVVCYFGNDDKIRYADFKYIIKKYKIRE